MVGFVFSAYLPNGFRLNYLQQSCFQMTVAINHANAFVLVFVGFLIGCKIGELLFYKLEKTTVSVLV